MAFHSPPSCLIFKFGDQLDDAALRELASGALVQRLNLCAQRSDGLDECTREMFALAMLVRLGKVTEEDIRSTFSAFNRLDVNRDGVLNSGSIIAGMIQRRRMQPRQTTPVPMSHPPSFGVPFSGSGSTMHAMPSPAYSGSFHHQNVIHVESPHSLRQSDR